MRPVLHKSPAPTRTLSLALTLLLILLTLTSTSLAQYRSFQLPCLAPLLEKFDPDAPETWAQAFLAGPNQRAPTLKNIGLVDFPITTPSPDTQSLFNQGVALLHGLAYKEAERSFRSALLHDPENPMALWGLAMANELRPARAKLFVERAKRKLRPETTPRERAWIQSLNSFYQPGDSPELEPDRIARHQPRLPRPLLRSALGSPSLIVPRKAVSPGP